MFKFVIDKKPIEKEIIFSDIYDVIVVGGGPAGANAALYAKRKGLDVLLITSKAGGQMVDTNLIENYLGETSITGENLNNNIINHLNSIDVPILYDDLVANVSKENYLFYLTLDSKKVLKSKTVIIATGASPRKLDIPGEKTLYGKGVTYCAICDGPFYKDKDIAVIGGGNAAIETALDLANIAKSVSIIELQKEFSADQILIDRLNQTKNINYYLNKRTLEFCGNNKLEKLRFTDNSTQKETSIDVEGVFIQVGSVPNSSLVNSLVKVNNHNEIIVDSEQRTTLEGLYAVGDVTNFPYKQIIIAASQGAIAALNANNYIKREDI